MLNLDAAGGGCGEEEIGDAAAPPPLLQLKLKSKIMDSIITEVSREELKIGNAVFASMRGSRRDQEDRACGGEFSSPIGLIKVACVIDGHGGDLAADFVKKNFLEISSKLFETLNCIENITKTIEEAFVSTNRLLKEKYTNTNSGACVLASFEIDGKFIAIASAGDCRSMQIKKDGTFGILSPEHKASDELEEKRITNAGLFVEHGRVNGVLAVSRSIGDFEFQGDPANLETLCKKDDFEERYHGVSCIPDVLVYSLENTEAIFLFTDGVYEVLSTEDVAKMYKEKKIMELEEFCSSIVSTSIEFGSTDNVTFAAIKY